MNATITLSLTNNATGDRTEWDFYEQSRECDIEDALSRVRLMLLGGGYRIGNRWPWENTPAVRAKGETMIEKLKNWNVAAGDVDEAVELYAIGIAVVTAYNTLSITTPSWLEEKLRDVESEVKRRARDEKVRRLKEAQLKLNSLKTAEEKRGELKAEIEKLTAELG